MKQVPWVSNFLNYSFPLKYSIPALTSCILIPSHSHKNLQAKDANEYKRIQPITLQVLEEPFLSYFFRFTGIMFRFKIDDYY